MIKHTLTLLLGMSLMASAQLTTSFADKPLIAGSAVDAAADYIPVWDDSVTSGPAWKRLRLDDVVNIPGFFGAVPNGTFTLSKLAQSGASSGQVPIWSGSNWSPGTIFSNLTAGPVRSTGGTSSIAVGAIPIDRITALPATLTEINDALINRVELGGIVGSADITVTGTGYFAIPYVITAGDGLARTTGDTLIIPTAKTPASASAAGVAGQIARDANYIYVCTATNTWKRVAISSW